MKKIFSAVIVATTFMVLFSSCKKGNNSADYVGIYYNGTWKTAGPDGLTITATSLTGISLQFTSQTFNATVDGSSFTIPKQAVNHGYYIDSISGNGSLNGRNITVNVVYNGFNNSTDTYTATRY